MIFIFGFHLSQILDGGCGMPWVPWMPGCPGIQWQSGNPESGLRGTPGLRTPGLRTMTLAVVTLRLVSEVFAVRPSIVSKGSLSGLDPKEISI